MFIVKETNAITIEIYNIICTTVLLLALAISALILPPFVTIIFSICSAVVYQQVLILKSG